MRSILSALSALWLLLPGCAAGSEPAEPVSFVIDAIPPGPTTLIIALFRAGSPEWDKRFKRVEHADLLCRQAVAGTRTREVITCELPAGDYIGLAFADTDGNGTLTHGLFGPTEAFGLTGIGRAITFPPEAVHTVIDVRQSKRFTIVLN